MSANLVVLPLETDRLTIIDVKFLPRICILWARSVSMAIKLKPLATELSSIFELMTPVH